MRGSDDGAFAIPAVRPGTYTLHAFADGVLGEFVQADVTVAGGQALDLGQLTWTPLRRGVQLWEIGIPNRSGKEFFQGDAFWKPNISQSYATLFPNDITYTVGKSDYRKDWFFQHVPRGPGQATTRSVPSPIGDEPRRPTRTSRGGVAWRFFRRVAVLTAPNDRARSAARRPDARHGDSPRRSAPLA